MIYPEQLLKAVPAMADDRGAANKTDLEGAVSGFFRFDMNVVTIS